MYNYASNIGSVLDSLRDLLDDGHAEQVITLAEHAVEGAEDAVGCVDDSDGWMSGIAERLRDLHLAACEAARPDPVTLARTLFDRERHDGDLEVFHGSASAYADVLGERGLAEYRSLAQQEWDALPPLGPDDERQAWSSGRFRITQIMHTLAELTGDADAVVGVLARDQSSAYQFVRIAEVLREAGRYEDALEWALKGLASHGHSDSRLVEVAAEEHHRAGRGGQAVEVLWAAYDAAPGLRTYRYLAEHAQRAVAGHPARPSARAAAEQDRREAEQPSDSWPVPELAGAGARQLNPGRGAVVRRSRRAGVGRGKRQRMSA